MAASLTNALLARASPLYTARALRVTVSRSAPGVFLSCIRGHLNLAGAKLLGDALLTQAAQDRRYLLIFHDWSEMVDYDADARVLLTDVARTVLPNTDAIHLYVTSTVVTFGVRVAGVILKKVTSHPTARGFELALEDALARPTRARAS